jgi:iron complex outermembrane recepter protein
LLQATAVGALTLPGALMFPNVASGQIAVTLPEVTVTAPRRPPAQRAARAVAPPGAAQSARVSAPAPSPPPTPASAPQIPAFQVVATTPVTGLGVYSPNVTQTLDQRIPGVFISDVQGNEFTSDLRYRGFTYRGTEFDASGGSYGRVGGSLQYGIRNGEWALYFAAQGLKDDGWRYQSPSRIARFYGDLGWKGTDAEVHLVASAADNYFGVIGPTPVELLNNDYRSIVTWPQTTKTRRSSSPSTAATPSPITGPSRAISICAIQKAHVDGNGAEVDQANPLFNTLCLENDGFPTQPQANFQILNANNQPINCPPGSGNTCATTPWGTVDRTFTNGLAAGGTLQATNDDKILGHNNYFTIGGSIDHSNIGFQANSELGYVFPDLFVGPNAAVPGTGQIIHTAANLGFSPVSLDAQNTYYGVYANETFDVTTRLSLTAGARYNLAKIAMGDLLGTSPDLNGNFTFSRLNPVVGLTYKILPKMTFYTGYSEANRAPTPLELGCANPAKPCLLEGFLVSDPPLQQVVARTREAGLRGNVKVDGGALDWKLGLFRTDSQNDIIQVSSII